MKIEVSKEGRKVIAYLNTETNSLFFKTGGKGPYGRIPPVLRLTTDGLINKTRYTWKDVQLRSDFMRPLYEGDVITITL